MEKIYLFPCFLVNLVVLAIFVGHAEAQAPQVTLPGTSNTVLRGTYIPFNESDYLKVDITIEAFLGIPFAEPPVGDLRFKNPVKKGALGRFYLADRDRSTCPQVNAGENEDCLYLGVHTSSPRVCPHSSKDVRLSLQLHPMICTHDSSLNILKLSKVPFQKSLNGTVKFIDSIQWIH